MTKKHAPKRHAEDATRRNVRAANKRFAMLELAVAVLTERVDTLEATDRGSSTPDRDSSSTAPTP